MGLSIMSYRAGLIGEKFNIRRRDATGTVVTCLLPLEREVSLCRAESEIFIVDDHPWSRVAANLPSIKPTILLFAAS